MAKAAPKKRTFKKTTKLIHDLYKLEVADAIKNIAWEKNRVQYEDIPHVHFFHTIDSKGSPQNTCTAINGHFHVMELVEPATENSPAVYKCSPPMVWGSEIDRRTGMSKKRLMPANPDDTHTHEVTYRDSHEVVPAKINPEFLKLSQELNKAPPSVDGIQG